LNLCCRNKSGTTKSRLLPADEIALVAGQQASYGQRMPDDKPGR